MDPPRRRRQPVALVTLAQSLPALQGDLHVIGEVVEVFGVDRLAVVGVGLAVLGREQLTKALQRRSAAEHRTAEGGGVDEVAVVVGLASTALAVSKLRVHAAGDRQPDERRPSVGALDLHVRRVLPATQRQREPAAHSRHVALRG